MTASNGLKTARLLAAAAFGGLTLVGVGCKNPMYTDNQKLHAENSALRDQVESMRGSGEIATAPQPAPMALPTPAPTPAPMPAPMPPPSAAPTGTVIFSPKQTPPPAAPAQPKIEGVESEFNAGTGEQTMRVAGDVLFDSGSATLKPTARKTLSQVASTLNGEFAGKKVRVEGHTDSDPIRKSKNKFPTNEALSLARAQAVTQYLEQQGVESGRLDAKGMGATKPRGGPKSADRRVEIVVVTR